jgi:Icc protein
MPELILQLSDLHVFCDPRKRLRGVPTYDSFVDVLDHARSHIGEPRLVIVTGDVAHDEQRKTYELVRAALAPWLDRLIVLPGNHDQRAPIRAVFGDRYRDGDCPEPYVTCCCEIGDWMLLGLDSHCPGEITGRVADEQAEWLETRLQRAGRRRCLLFLHHPPASVDSAWLDELGLLDSEQLLVQLRRYDNVAGVIAGHVHQDFSGVVEGRPFFTTPSTAMQFTPGQSQPSYDPAPPGYRVIRLQGTDWSTRVERLPVLRFPPAADAGDRTEEE